MAVIVCARPAPPNSLAICAAATKPSTVRIRPGTRSATTEPGKTEAMAAASNGTSQGWSAYAQEGGGGPAAVKDSSSPKERSGQPAASNDQPTTAATRRIGLRASSGTDQCSAAGRVGVSVDDMKRGLPQRFLAEAGWDRIEGESGVSPGEAVSSRKSSWMRIAG